MVCKKYVVVEWLHCMEDEIFHSPSTWQGLQAVHASGEKTEELHSDISCSVVLYLYN